MGLLSQGKPLDWEETKKYAKFVQERGIAQFINIYNKSKDRADSPFKWGDEVEYILVKFDHAQQVARVSLKAEKTFRKLAEQHKHEPKNSRWNPEFAAYMVEGTPAMPYGNDDQLLEGLCSMESNMRLRREEVQALLDKDEIVISLTSFPRLGCKNFTHPIFQPKPETSASGSIFFPDEAIFNGHPRFKTLVRNIRSRRKRKVIINVPIFKDKNTIDPFYEHFDDLEAKRAAIPDHIYLDAMGFGMGCCCVQVTLQATHLAECKNLYDQLAPICPIALALSAASPIYRGYLADIDCRWQIIAAAVDDRTAEESNEINGLKESEYKIPKSRYETLSLYLSKKGQDYNDTKVTINQKHFLNMISKGIDIEVARHIASLFVRDPITLYKEKLEQKDEEMDHFENIQSTNWFNMRFKPPPSQDSPIGWRVEFRPLEAQTTDFENAAYATFVILLSRVILAYKLNFLIPISLLDENMAEAQKRDAVRESKFWFRTDIMPKSNAKPLSTNFDNSTNSRCSRFTNSNSANQANSSNTTTNHSLCPTNTVAKNDRSCARLMTIDEIINGSSEFVGLLDIVDHYVDSLNDGTNLESICMIKKYLKLISDRASLRASTTARWIREFVTKHPDYKQDSVVSDKINYDLISEMDKMGKNLVYHQELFGTSMPNSGCKLSKQQTSSTCKEEQPMDCEFSRVKSESSRKSSSNHHHHSNQAVNNNRSQCAIGIASRRFARHLKCKSSSCSSNSSRSVSR